MMKRIWTVCSISLVLLCVSAIQIGAEEVCFQCHDRKLFTGKFVHGPVAVDKCSACHNPHAAKHNSLLTLAEDKLCYSCHEQEKEAFQKNVVHEPVYEGKCTICHNPHASASKNLLSGDLAGECFKCHQELLKKHIYTHEPFVAGECTSCHNPHNSTNMQLLIEDKADTICWTCHDQAGLDEKHKNYPLPVKDCLTCHNPHGSDRPALVHNYLHKPYETGCTECHDPQSGKVPDGTCLKCHQDITVQMASTHNHLTRRDGNSCLNCHSPHSGDKPSLLRSQEKQVCYSCHYNTLVKFKESKHKHSKIENCTDCHESHGSTSLAMLKGDGTSVCTGCHESQGAFSHPIGPDVLDSRTGQVMTCVTCHNSMGTEHEYHLILDGNKALCNLCHVAY